MKVPVLNALFHQRMEISDYFQETDVKDFEEVHHMYRSTSLHRDDAVLAVFLETRSIDFQQTK